MEGDGDVRYEEEAEGYEGRKRCCEEKGKGYDRKKGRLKSGERKRNKEKREYGAKKNSHLVV